jgi:hypothetical protein
MIAGYLTNCGTKVSTLVGFMSERGYRPFKMGIGRRGLHQSLQLTPIDIGNDVDADVLWTYHG